MVPAFFPVFVVTSFTTNSCVEKSKKINNEEIICGTIPVKIIQKYQNLTIIIIMDTLKKINSEEIIRGTIPLKNYFKKNIKTHRHHYYWHFFQVRHILHCPLHYLHCNLNLWPPRPKQEKIFFSPWWKSTINTLSLILQTDSAVIIVAWIFEVVFSAENNTKNQSKEGGKLQILISGSHHYIYDSLIGNELEMSLKYIMHEWPFSNFEKKNVVTCMTGLVYSLLILTFCFIYLFVLYYHIVYSICIYMYVKTIQKTKVWKAGNFKLKFVHTHHDELCKCLGD